MVEDTAHYSAMRAATIGIAIPNATRFIVEEITALIPASTEMAEQVALAEAVAVRALTSPISDLKFGVPR
jgi:hypothetical protein